MSDISLRRRHGRSPEEAKKIAEKIIAKVASEYDVKYRWKGDSVVFERSGLNGHLDVTADEIQIQAKLGLLLRPLKSRIEKEVNSVMDANLA